MYVSKGTMNILFQLYYGQVTTNCGDHGAICNHNYNWPLSYPQTCVQVHLLVGNIMVLTLKYKLILFRCRPAFGNVVPYVGGLHLVRCVITYLAFVRNLMQINVNRELFSQ
jgi:hypothetical protein